ncbi:MAG: 50S ribosome-binding GTPase [Marinilabiliales bacterium]|nr:50S ribosome-binding GTPase [Marinilabiliales bacterium]
MQPTVAIVGRPNVGKSRLFNRLARRRISIVHDMPGVTRDVVAVDVDGYTLLDTGGFGLTPGVTPKHIVQAVDRQVIFAIETAQVIIFVLDAVDGVASADATIAQRLRRSGKPVILVVNKVDHARSEAAVADAYRLGLGEPLGISAEHGIGEVDLRDRITAQLARFAAAHPAPAPVPEGERRAAHLLRRPAQRRQIVPRQPRARLANA